MIAPLSCDSSAWAFEAVENRHGFPSEADIPPVPRRVKPLDALAYRWRHAASDISVLIVGVAKPAIRAWPKIMAIKADIFYG